ncbi:hypothetical protein EC845_3675 [Comamonas sp. BIGb0124]|uniref:HAD-IIB family hydrolase n=1 Tax=Comamonas sp. BIGb0124 TaxID=2485130 RepID=UPI000F49084E|nr:HAD-IIB family hydrolase [Comamonas sp. BIGb0124]ROR17873.1 hypothetical protein EC845_3675 [Comamonas sp. BIGb0124]
MSHGRPPANRLRPLDAWPLAARAGLVGVLTDIDDTLTTEGQVPASTLAAMGALRQAGLAVIAITGRPVGWSLPFASTWPIDAIVAENGAVALLPAHTRLPHHPDGVAAIDAPSPCVDPTQRPDSPDAHRPRSDRGEPPAVRRLYQQDADVRGRNFARLQQIVSAIEHAVPGAHRASDSGGRETDIAIDHSEHRHLDARHIDQVVHLMRAAGLHASVSSIHINGWFGEHDKRQGAQWIVQSLLDRDLAAERERWAYIGDSTNDQRMFDWMPHSLGVANVRRFVPQLDHFPAYITPGERGAGFEEMAQAILTSRD